MITLAIKILLINKSIYRRRLEPLFEEDTETSSESESSDDDDKLPPDSSSDQVGLVRIY